MFVKPKGSKPTVSQFNLMERGTNEVDLLVGSLHRNASVTNTLVSGPKIQPSRDLFKEVSHMLTSQSQQQNDVMEYLEPKMSHRESRAHEFKKKPIQAKQNPFEASKPDTDSKLKQLMIQISMLGKRVDGMDTILREVRHNAQEMDKRASEATRKLQKSQECTKKQFTEGFKKMVKQINVKFVSTDKAMDSLRVQFDLLRDNEVVRPRVSESGWQVSQSKPELNILYGLDVKSSIDRIQCRPEGDQSQQLKQLNQQLDILRTEINSLNKNSQSNDTQKSKQQYQQLKAQLQNISFQLNKGTEFKVSECERVLQAHDQNIQKINLEFQKVINEQISPRILSIEESVRKIPTLQPTQDQASKKILDDLLNVRNDLQSRLKNSQVLKVRKSSVNEKDVIGKGQCLNMGDTYYLDQEHYLLDCKGVYILDEESKRIRISDDNIYFMNLHGINIMNIQ